MPKVTVRAPRPEDAQAAFAVIAARDFADLGFVDYTLEDVHADWTRPEVDAWVAELGSMIAGVAVVDHMGAMVCVHPEFCGQGVGTALRHAVEARMRERNQATLRQAIAATNTEARALLEAAGYQVGHTYLVMRAELNGRHGAGRANGDIRELRRPAEDAEAHRLVQEAFSEIDGHSPQPFDDWRSELLDRADALHPQFLALADASGLAGVLIGRAREGIGWVDVVAVAPRARGRGHGRALLQAALERFAAAGLPACELSVHGRNLAAGGLYGSVGMRETRRSERWEKPA